MVGLSFSTNVPVSEGQSLLYGFTGGGSRSQLLTHFTVLTSTSAFLCPEKLMSGRMSRVCVPSATLKSQVASPFRPIVAKGGNSGNLI